mgnify:CR=1 FL=1
MEAQGTWYLHSESDPRWNAGGTSNVGGFVIPESCRQKLEEFTQKMGEPPEDLTWGYMKE